MRVLCLIAGAALALSSCNDGEAPPDALAAENLTAEDMMVNEVVPSAAPDQGNEPTAASVVEPAEPAANVPERAERAAPPVANSPADRPATPAAPAPKPEPEPKEVPDPHAGHDMNTMNSD